MPTTTYPHIKRYHDELRQLIDFGGSANELNIRPAFQNCLTAYCQDHREKLALVPELPTLHGLTPDGTVKDSLRMARGYWEAKDTRDILDAEIQRKFQRGYPRDNIIFEDSRTAVLFQNRQEAMRVDMANNRDLHRLIRQFLDYELPEIEEFRKAQEQFKNDLPTVLQNLREAISSAEADNEKYRSAAHEFLMLCRRTISNDVASDDVREMLLQHILTKDIFQRVFAEDQFHRENNIAQQLDALEQTFFTGPVRRTAIERMRAYYGAIGRAADEIADYPEKQQFLKAIYEDFYKAYNPAAADRLGVVYTPNEVVDFIIRSTNHLLQKHFNRTLADDKVQILDPATGTGTFITNLINYLPLERLEYKYLHEIHANEVAILPYYIANLNIEYTYKERTSKYLEFPNLCFVDTLDNLEWSGASGESVERQSGMNLGGLSVENLERIRVQNEKPISVIIGNPPYNANQRNENENNKNREYPEIDNRIKETYVDNSTAQKTKQYDMYKRFIRWASDRLDDNGIIGFVSNSAFIDARQDDGFRQVIADEFNELWAIDLKGNARTSGERRRKEGGNIFEDKIRVGVAIYFLVRKQASNGFRILYNSVDDYQKAVDKVEYIKDQTLAGLEFTNITPDSKNNWLNQSNPNFYKLLTLADSRTKTTKNTDEEQAVFRLYSMGVSTNRDEWVYDFDVSNLRNKSLFFTDIYNGLIDDNDQSYPTVIKWSRDLRNEFQRRRRIVYNDGNRIQSLHRPFVIKHHFADFTINDRLSKNHYEMFADDLKQPNKVISFCVNGKDFYALAADKVVDLHFTGDTQCLPLYRYTDDGEKVSNITEWGIQHINNHYRKQHTRYYQEMHADNPITPEDIFAYTYAVLHHPKYRHEYKNDLLREFPRLPLYPNFKAWANIGAKLLDLHINFESANPYPLERHDKDGVIPQRAILRADKEKGIITIDERTSLSGIPDSAWNYRLGSRSALEWILDQYKERTPRDPTIRQRFNKYRFANHKEKVITLLQRVSTVSIKTTQIINNMPHTHHNKPQPKPPSESPSP